MKYSSCFLRANKVLKQVSVFISIRLLFYNWDMMQTFKFWTARHYEAVFLVHENRVDELQDVIKKVKG